MIFGLNLRRENHPHTQESYQLVEPEFLVVHQPLEQLELEA